MSLPELRWVRQYTYTGCMYHTLFALTGDPRLLTPASLQDHNFARWMLAAIERGYVPETVYSDSPAWRRELGSDALRPMPKKHWRQATWRYPEQEEEGQWALFALNVASRRRQGAEHMVALLITYTEAGWRFCVSDSTAKGDGVQWFESAVDFVSSHYGTVFEVIAMRPRGQAYQPWIIPEHEMPPLIEVTDHAL